MATSYLSLVNDVLVRLREPTVTSVSQTSYSALIGKLVNDSIMHVSDAYDWNCLRNTLSADTTSDIFNYVLVGSGDRFRVISVINDTQDVFMTPVSSTKMTQYFLLNGGSSQKGAPTDYNFNGVDNNGDTQVDIYPIPDKTYNLRFNIIQPEAELTTDIAVTKVPKQPVVLGAYARALVERGEDAGLSSSEAYGLFKASLADAVAIESSRYGENEVWVEA
jgi:hypothetical protein